MFSASTLRKEACPALLWLPWYCPMRIRHGPSNAIHFAWLRSSWGQCMLHGSRGHRVPPGRAPHLSQRKGAQCGNSATPSTFFFFCHFMRKCAARKQPPAEEFREKVLSNVNIIYNNTMCLALSPTESHYAKPDVLNVCPFPHFSIYIYIYICKYFLAFGSLKSFWGW